MLGKKKTTGGQQRRAATRPTAPRRGTSAAVAKAAKKTVPLPADINNPNGYSPEVWGPHMWFMFHLVAATYPEAPTAADKTNFKAFYTSLKHVLPCPGCRVGYNTIITTEPTKMEARVFANRPNLFKWTVDVHNRVNAKLGKPIHADWRAWYREYNKLR